MGPKLLMYIAYLALSAGLTAWVARVLYRNGQVFLDDALGNERLARSVNHLLVVGFYLLNLGYAAVAIRVSGDVLTAADAVGDALPQGRCGAARPRRRPPRQPVRTQPVPSAPAPDGRSPAGAAVARPGADRAMTGPVPGRLTVLYDGGCPLCRAARRWLAGRVQLVPLDFVEAGSAAAAHRFPGLDHAGTLAEVTVVADTGAVYSGDAAWLICLWALDGYRALALRLAQPRLRPLARRVVRAAATIREGTGVRYVHGCDDACGRA